MSQATIEKLGGPNHDIPRPQPVGIPPELQREIKFRVAVISEGAITPIGNSADETWDNLLAMKTGFELKPYHPYTEPTMIEQDGKLVEADPQIRAITAGTVKDFDSIKALVKTGVMPMKEVKFKMGGYSSFALAAVYEALSKIKASNGEPFLVPRLKEDGTLNKERQWIVNRRLVDPLYVSTFVGTGFGGGAVSAEVLALLKAGLIPSGDHMMRSLSDRAASLITQAFGINGGAEADTAACASSGKATLNGMFRIGMGLSEVVIDVGTESLETPIIWDDKTRPPEENPITAAEFDAFDALDRGRDPREVSLSLHKDRRGFVPAEGAIAKVMCDPAWARLHGIPILYEIVGFGDTSGAGHNTDPNTEAQEWAMKFGRRRAEHNGPVKGNVFVSGHLTATWFGERSEVFAIQNSLDDLQDRTTIYGSKRMVGHLLGAAGKMSQLAAGRVIRTGIVPGMPFVGEMLDEVYGWNVPKETYYDEDVTDALVNQFGFGDANVSLWLRRTN